MFLLRGGIPGVCYSAEPETPIPQDEPVVTELEHIGPDYALERSERKFIPYEGKIIGSIRIKRLEVFDASVNDTTRVKSTMVETKLNEVNFDTKNATILKNLLFKVGDIIDSYVLADSERLLRRLNFIKDARIVVIPDAVNKNNASILVIVKDQWSLILAGALKKDNAFRVSMTEGNLLGLGHQVSGELSHNPNATPRYGFSYSVQNIEDSFITGKLDYFKSPAVTSGGLEFSRELISPVLKYSGGLELQRTATKIDDSHPFFADNTYDLFGFWMGKTIRFKPLKTDIDRRRSVVISGRFRHVGFTQYPDITDSTWYRYYDKTYYLGNIAFIQHRYYQTNLLYNYDRTESIPYGFRANLTSGIVADNFRSRWYVSTTLTGGNRIEGLGYGAGKVSFSGCPVGGAIELGILKIQTLYFTDILNFGNFRFRQFLKTEYSTGIHRFDDDTIDFTQGESIRGVGYNHRVTGSQRLFLGLDSVMFTPWKLHSFSFTLFSFADLDIIGSNKKNIFMQDYYSGVGLGVRIHSETFGIETVQVRLAWYPNLPVDHDSYVVSAFREKRVFPIDFIGSKPEILEY